MGKLRRLAPPAGPRYDLWELAIVIAMGALLIYVVQSANSAVEAWLTAPGQTAAGICMFLGAVVGGGLTYRDKTFSLATWIICCTSATWAITLTIGLVLEFRPGSAFFVLLFLFFVQIARKIWGRYVIERDFPDCRIGAGE